MPIFGHAINILIHVVPPKSRDHSICALKGIDPIPFRGGEGIDPLKVLLCAARSLLELKTKLHEFS